MSRLLSVPPQSTHVQHATRHTHPKKRESRSASLRLIVFSTNSRFKTFCSEIGNSMKMQLWMVFLLGASYLSLSDALECYVCRNQEGNIEKCLNTIKTCEQEQDACLTEIAWGSTPYWNQGAKKQFYVSKRCARKRECEQIRKNNMPDCTHIWYQDWKCSECCQGDRCNYYVISGSNKIGVALMSLFLPLLLLWK